MKCFLWINYLLKSKWLVDYQDSFLCSRLMNKVFSLGEQTKRDQHFDRSPYSHQVTLLALGQPSGPAN